MRPALSQRLVEDLALELADEFAERAAATDDATGAESMRAIEQMLRGAVVILRADAHRLIGPDDQHVH